MKRAWSVFLTALIVAAASTAMPAAAVSAADDIRVFVNSIMLEMDVAPKIINGRTMIPVRAVSEAIGCKVEWIGAERRVNVYTPDSSGLLLAMYIDNPNVTRYNGNNPEQVKIDSPPVIIDGRTIVPLRFIAEAMGFTADWNGGSRVVSLYNGNSRQNRFLARVSLGIFHVDTSGGYVWFDIDDVLMIGPEDTEAIKKFGLESAWFDNDYELINPNPEIVQYRATTQTEFIVEYSDDGYELSRRYVDLSGFVEYINSLGRRKEEGVLAEVTVSGSDIVSVKERYTP